MKHIKLKRYFVGFRAAHGGGETCINANIEWDTMHVSELSDNMKKLAAEALNKTIDSVYIDCLTELPRL